MENGGLINAFAYLRVSTEEQGTKGFSIEEQRDDSLYYSKVNGYNIINYFIDDGYSASTVKRPAFQQMLSEITKGEVRVIILRDPSRLIRNLTLKRSIENVMNKYNVAIKYLHSEINTKTPEGAFHSDFVALWDESEIRRIGPRTINGLRGSASLGNYPLGGPSPRGFKKEFNKRIGKGHYLVPDETEAPQVIKLFETLATNRMTTVDMIKYLNKIKLFGMKWSRNVLYRIVDNPIYYGRLATKWFDSEDKNITEEFRHNWYSNELHTHPLITKELWLDVQAAVHQWKKKSKHTYIFNRLVYCLDTEEFCVNESAWKTSSDRKIKTLYKYYKVKQGKNRISEKKILEAFEVEYCLHQMSKINRNIYKKLEREIELKQKRRIYLSEDFDNSFIDEDDYRSQIREINISILQSKKSLNNLKDKHKEFRNFNDDKKRAIVFSYVERVNINFQDNIIDFVYRE